MERYDVFNGDADGLCGLQQLRLTEPGPSTLLTGVKRDVRLLAWLEGVADAQVNVLDISFHENRQDVAGLLERGCRVRYFDHHYAGEVPAHPRFEPHLDPSPRVCTSLLVDQYLGGAHRPWAVVAAFGDNLPQSAREAAQTLGLSPHTLKELQALGELLNYNGYGDTLDDLHYHPALLFKAMQPFEDPLAFFRASSAVDRLQYNMGLDLAMAQARQPDWEWAWGWVFRFPGGAWATRVMGVHANHLTNLYPDRALALMVYNQDGTLRVSVRSPANRPHGADALCRQFPTGGGREAAAGINRFHPVLLPRFLDLFRQAYEV
ncbi:MAG: acetyltransferase [Deltaproteobacteria bacterium]|nr:acetyltransferase [Deltaproteobacteria bacterium]